MEDRVAELLDELGELLEAENMVLAFDEDEQLIGFAMGPKAMVNVVADELEDLFSLTILSPDSEGEVVH